MHESPLLQNILREVNPALQLGQFRVERALPALFLFHQVDFFGVLFLGFVNPARDQLCRENDPRNLSPQKVFLLPREVRVGNDAALQITSN